MDIAGWRKQIDELDRKLVELLNQRARAAHEIGRLKRNTQMPIYEPDREKIIHQNVCAVNQGPLSDSDIMQIFECIVSIMRRIQKDEIVPRAGAAAPGTQTENES